MSYCVENGAIKDKRMIGRKVPAKLSKGHEILFL